MKKIAIVVLPALILATFLLVACQKANESHGTKQDIRAANKKPVDISRLKARPFKGINLEKEWVLKEDDTSLPLSIVSITSNKNGVYVLVENVATTTVQKKLSELSEKEREEEIEKMKWSFGRILSEEEYMKEPGYGKKIFQIEHYRIQHYAEDGNFISQWNGENEGKGFIKPKRIVSDEAGNIYVADYGTNKIKKDMEIWGQTFRNHLTMGQG